MKKLDRQVFVKYIKSALGMNASMTPNELSGEFTVISHGCDASMFRRRRHRNHESAYWWSSEIAKLRNCYTQQWRIAQ